MASPAVKRPRRYIDADVARQMVADDNDEHNIPDTSDDERLEDEEVEEAFEPQEEETDSEDSDASDDGDRRFAGRGDTTSRTWQWVKKDLPPHTGSENELKPRGPALNCRTPLDMFTAHFDDELIDLLVLETNRQRLSLNPQHVAPVTNTLRNFFGICLYMTIVDLPYRRMYWSAATKQSFVSTA